MLQHILPFSQVVSFEETELLYFKHSDTYEVPWFAKPVAVAKQIIGDHEIGDTSLLLDDVSDLQIGDYVVVCALRDLSWSRDTTVVLVGSGSDTEYLITLTGAGDLTDLQAAVENGEVYGVSGVGISPWTMIASVDNINKTITLRLPLTSNISEQNLTIGPANNIPVRITEIDTVSDVISISQPITTAVEGSVTPEAISFLAQAELNYTVPNANDPAKINIKYFSDGGFFPAGKYRLECLAGNFNYLNEDFNTATRKPRNKDTVSDILLRDTVPHVAPYPFVEKHNNDPVPVLLSAMNGDTETSLSELGFFVTHSNDIAFDNVFLNQNSAQIFDDFDTYQYPNIVINHAGGKIGVMFHAYLGETYHKLVSKSIVGEALLGEDTLVLSDITVILVGDLVEPITGIPEGTTITDIDSDLSTITLSAVLTGDIDGSSEPVTVRIRTNADSDELGLTPTASLIDGETPVFRLVPLEENGSDVLVANQTTDTPFPITYRDRQLVFVKRNGGGKVVIAVSGVTTPGEITVSYFGQVETLAVSADGTYTTNMTLATKVPECIDPLKYEVVELYVSGDEDIEASPELLNWELDVNVNNLPGMSDNSLRQIVVYSPSSIDVLSNVFDVVWQVMSIMQHENQFVYYQFFADGGTVPIKTIDYYGIIASQAVGGLFQDVIRFPYSASENRNLRIVAYDSLERTVTVDVAFVLKTTSLINAVVRPKPNVKLGVGAGITVKWENYNLGVMGYSVELRLDGDNEALPIQIPIAEIELLSPDSPMCELTILDIRKSNLMSAYISENVQVTAIIAHTPFDSTLVRYMLLHKEHSELSVILTPKVSSSTIELPAQESRIIIAGSGNGHVAVFSAKTQYFSEMTGFDNDDDRLLEEWEPVSIQTKLSNGTTIGANISWCSAFNGSARLGLPMFGFISGYTPDGGVPNGRRSRLFKITLTSRLDNIIEIPATYGGYPIHSVVGPVIDKLGYGYFFCLWGGPRGTDRIITLFKINPYDNSLDRCNYKMSSGDSTLANFGRRVGASNIRYEMMHMCFDRNGNLWSSSKDRTRIYRTNLTNWPNLTAANVSIVWESASYKINKVTVAPYVSSITSDYKGNIIAVIKTFAVFECGYYGTALHYYSGFSGALLFTRSVSVTCYYRTAQACISSQEWSTYGGFILANVLDLQVHVRAYQGTATPTNNNTFLMNRSGAGVNPQPANNTLLCLSSFHDILSAESSVYKGSSTNACGLQKMYVGELPYGPQVTYPQTVQDPDLEEDVIVPDNVLPTSTYSKSNATFEVGDVEYLNKYHPMWHPMYNIFDTNTSTSIEGLDRAKAWVRLCGKPIKPHSLPASGDRDGPVTYDVLTNNGVEIGKIKIYRERSATALRQAIAGTPIPVSTCIINKTLGWTHQNLDGDLAGFVPMAFAAQDAQEDIVVLLEPQEVFYDPPRFHTKSNV